VEQQANGMFPVTDWSAAQGANLKRGLRAGTGAGASTSPPAAARPRQASRCAGVSGTREAEGGASAQVLPCQVWHRREI